MHRGLPQGVRRCSRKDINGILHQRNIARSSEGQHAKRPSAQTATNNECTEDHRKVPVDADAKTSQDNCTTEALHTQAKDNRKVSVRTNGNE
jgi:hypothetical protein